MATATNYHHFTKEERVEIEVLKKQGFSLRFIRIKYPIACVGVRNTVSGPGPSLGFDTNRGRRGVGIHCPRTG